MIERKTLKEVKEALLRQAAVALIGPRQVGKTTLARQLALEQKSIYLDLETVEDQQKLSNPIGFLSAYDDRLVILDEIHRVPELFLSLRGIIDEGRRKGKRHGRFLLLGSASVDLLRQSGESLAGRISYIDMTPLQISEIPPGQVESLWIRGGFPDSFLSLTEQTSLDWRRDLIRTYLERDIPMFGSRVPAETLRRFWTMLAHNQSTLLNASKLGAALEVSSQSVTRYIDLLVDLLLVRRLQPYFANVGKRLVKSPKVYLRDSGLLHSFLNVRDREALLGHPVVGASWAGFAIEQLINAAPSGTVPGFYRTAGGAELDLLLELPGGARWAIEIKRSRVARPSRGFYEACEDLQPARRFVVHGTDDRFPISAQVEAIGLVAMIGLLAGLGH